MKQVHDVCDAIGGMKPISVPVGARGEIEIPAAIREMLGIAPDTRVDLSVIGGQVILKPQTIPAKLRMIEAMRGITAGLPSGTDLLLEERRCERERELRDEGF